MALTLLATATASTSTTIDFTSGIDGTYLVYELHLIGVTVATNGSRMSLQVSTDSGTSWKAGASDYETISIHSGYSSSSGTTNIPIAPVSDDLGSSAGQNLASVVTIFCPSNTAVRTQVLIERSSFNSASTVNKEVYAGSYKATTAVNGIRIMLASGTTIDTGEFKLYGVAAS